MSKFLEADDYREQTAQLEVEAGYAPDHESATIPPIVGDYTRHVESQVEFQNATGLQADQSAVEYINAHVVALPHTSMKGAVVTEDSSASPVTSSLPLHSPSLPPSPRGAEMASSEEESVAEFGDVSEGEGECSSVEDFHDPETLRRRRQDELDQRRVQQSMMDSSGSVVAIAKQVSMKESKALRKCARFSTPDDDTESLIDHPISAAALQQQQPPRRFRNGHDQIFAVASSGNTQKLNGPPTVLSRRRGGVDFPQSSVFDAASTDAIVNTKLPFNSSLRHHERTASCENIVKPAALAPSTLRAPTINSRISKEGKPSSRSVMGSGSITFRGLEHTPTSLPTFKEPRACMWTSSHAANSPSEDRSASLVNVLLQPLPPHFNSNIQSTPLGNNEYHSLIRLNLWSVIDGHGGGCVATYASEVLLPHIAASISRALGCTIVSRGVCLVNGQLRDANALDLDGLIKTSDRSPANPNSIHYRSPCEASEDSDEDGEAGTNSSNRHMLFPDVDDATRDSSHTRGEDAASIAGGTPPSISPSLMPLRSTDTSSSAAQSDSSVKTSVRTAASAGARDAPIGTHSPNEVAAITRAITSSFLAVDEGWINSIDPVATHQTSCQSNGRWNSGACALTVFTIQRLEWTSVSEEHRERELCGPAKSRGHDTSQNKDAARRRMLDYAARAKTSSSLSTTSTTSSLTTTEDRVNTLGLESEITETEGEDDDHTTLDGGEKPRHRNTFRRPDGTDRIGTESLISAPGGCSCHCYRAYDALLYTAHVGDCRAVMLGSAPPRTIKVHGSNTLGHENQTDDESSHHSSDETECLSSSDHDADSSDDEEIEFDHYRESSNTVKSTSTAASSYMAYMRRPARRQSRRRRYDDLGMNAPFIALPPLEAFRSVEIETDDLEYERRRRHQYKTIGASDSSSSSSQDSREFPPAIILPPATRPIDLTTDHSAYNPAEVTAVLRRCNNAPRAISAGVGGGIKRVAGSLAVTRALGDAYLKTPLLSFFPYKRHAPYITARPEVNCRPIVKEGDKVLILATDGVWERASGEDVLRWVRTFYAERIAEADRRNSVSRLSEIDDQTVDDGYGNKDDDSFDSQHAQGETQDELMQQSASRNEVSGITSTSSNLAGNRKRDMLPSPSTAPVTAKRRKMTCRRTARRAAPFGSRRNSTVADVIVRRVLNKVRRARNISSLNALMSLPPGRARRSKHDDITSCVVDLSAFVS